MNRVKVVGSTVILIALIFGAGCSSSPGKPSSAPSLEASQKIKADEITDPVMQYRLGMHYLFGISVEQNYGKAVKWFTQSARQGYLSAQNNLGTLYAQGLGVSRNYREAFKWLDRAARRGSADAQQNLGLMYASGLGVDRDYHKAFMWFRLSAAQGHAGAQAQLGGLYSQGHGVDRDHLKAVKWFRKAARQGNSYAQYHLALSYRDGRGLPADEVQAYKWFLLSAQNPREDSLEGKKTLSSDIETARQKLEQKLTADQLEEAQAMARQWKPSPGANSTNTPPRPSHKKRQLKTARS